MTSGLGNFILWKIYSCKVKLNCATRNIPRLMRELYPSKFVYDEKAALQQWERQPWRDCIKLLLFWCCSHPRTLAFTPPFKQQWQQCYSCKACGPGSSFHTLAVVYLEEEYEEWEQPWGWNCHFAECTNVAFGSSVYRLERFSLYKQTMQEQTSNYNLSDSYHVSWYGYCLKSSNPASHFLYIK